MTDEQIQQAEQMLFDGAIQKYVALRLGVSCSTLRKYLNARKGGDPNVDRSTKKTH